MRSTGMICDDPQGSTGRDVKALNQHRRSKNRQHRTTTMRYVVFLWLMTSVAATALAQEPKPSIPPTVPQPHEEPNRIVYDLEISAADEPHPAMKYRLLPDPADLK